MRTPNPARFVEPDCLGHVHDRQVRCRRHADLADEPLEARTAELDVIAAELDVIARAKCNGRILFSAARTGHSCSTSLGAGADLESELVSAFGNRPRAADGTGRTVERGEEPVVGRLELPPPEAADPNGHPHSARWRVHDAYRVLPGSGG
jgi:hypothetical protein